ncbi:MAG: hypothetical protein JST54_05430 [Deltaproteobacteria bacterium]|nr:hypothetical protein [Deltaproteobacteria bacterium]
MKFVVLLAGMAILAWIIATQLNTAKVVAAGDGTVQGTPQQIVDQTKQRAEAAMKQEQKHLDQAGNLAGSPASAVPAEEP